SLLEVIVATAIFLMALVGLRQLVSVAGDQAIEVEMRSQATRMCQSKMAEVLSGILPLSSASDTFDEDPDYTWTLDVEPGTVPNPGGAPRKVQKTAGRTSAHPARGEPTQVARRPRLRRPPLGRGGHPGPRSPARSPDRRRRRPGTPGGGGCGPRHGRHGTA